MKIFSAAGRPDKSRRSFALNCLIVNQFATPGLGSLMGRRFFAGTIQLVLALGGFLMFIYGMTGGIYRTIYELPEPTGIRAHLGIAGLVLFVLSWVLAWFTSLSLLRQAPREDPPKLIPPIIPPPKL
jgi:hypothetical protein